jgi:hypothetical protein
MTIQSSLDALATAVDSVTGLRVQTDSGKANTPAAVIELAGIRSPVAMGGVTVLAVRIRLLVQVGEFRNVLERIHTYADPNGTTATSVYAALLAYAPAGDIEFDGPGLVEYGGQTYGGGVFSCEIFA